MKEANISESPMERSGALRYHLEVDLSDSNKSQTQLALLCGENKNVLEVGPATGYVTKLLRDRGCEVTAIEIDPEAADQAAPYCRRMIVADIEQVDFDEALDDCRFDVVLYGDVLEHLVDPLRILRETRRFLSANGYVVASLPNVAHGSLRMALLTGRFSYTETGLLDRTHLHFYDRAGVQSLFEEAGYEIREWRRVVIDLFQTEVDVPTDLPPHLVEAVKVAPEATTYQFVVLADPVRERRDTRQADGGPEGDASDLGALWELEHRTAELTSRIPSLEAELAQNKDELAQKKAELVKKDKSFNEVVAAYERATGTRGYRALQRLYLLLERVAPSGTARRRTLIAVSRPFVRLMSGEKASTPE